MVPRRIALLASAAVVLAACYRPSITNGGLLCSAAGACPEGFRCNTLDGRCYRPDSGPSCTDAQPHLASLCDDPPPAGSACNPACQTGCTCGRCTLIDGVAQCVPLGGKSAGDLCSLASDDCGVGLGCVKESCGTNLGRCRQFCNDTTVTCSSGLFCQAVSVGSPFMICDPPFEACNPVTGGGCKDPALSCYLRLGSQTGCACPGAGPDCAFPTDCVPGFTCIGMDNLFHCFQVCDSQGAACPASAPSCNTSVSGPRYGFCM